MDVREERSGMTPSNFDDINFKKLIKQEKAFAEYLEDVSTILINTWPEETLRVFYSFYQEGIDAKSMANIIHKNSRWQA